MALKSIKKLRSLKGKRVILRASLNVPIVNRDVHNDFRLIRGLPTLKYLLDKGAKVIVVGHIGRSPDDMLRPVCRYMNRFLPLGYLPDNDRERTKMLIEKMQPGTAFMLENLRRFSGETENSKSFAEDLAELGDIYVNDAFAASHREHASIVGLPKLLPSYAGLSMMDEIEHLSKVLKPKKPLVVVLGGAKFATKVPLVKKLLPKSSQVFICGALANTFYKEMGFNVGKSLTDKDKINLKVFLKSKKVTLPTDIIAVGKKGAVLKSPEEVNSSDNILDIGPESLAEIKEAVRGAAMVLWNGPLGHFESGFRQTTEELAKTISRARGQSIVGGGDTLSAISELGILNKFNFVSTGGGAMLDYLADGTLVGIKALEKSK